MTSICLNQLPLFWTTCQKSKDRHPSMFSMLSKLGLSGIMIDGPITTPYTIGVAKGYIEALKKTTPPFIILEDDATLIDEKYFPNELYFPNDCDSLYLGTSVYGRIKKQTAFGGAIVANYNETLFRVFNMLGFHAVVYVSQNYINHVLQTLETFIENPIGGCDDAIAESMWKYNVYCLKNPIFYQKDGRSDQATKIQLDSLL